MKRFIYLIQAAAHMPYPEIPGPDSDVLLLTWQQQAKGTNTIFFPDNSRLRPSAQLLPGKKMLLVPLACCCQVSSRTSRSGPGISG